jgi:hypothetical protein
MAKTTVIWGHKLHSHTHSYIHEGFARAFAFLGYDVHWVDDDDDVSGIDFSGALFLTEGQVDGRIPIRRDCKYVLHNCDGERYASVRDRCLTIQVCCVNQLRGRTLDRVGPASYYADGVLYQPWATDLLPSEIRFDWADLPREAASYWVGTIGGGRFGNVNELAGFQRACAERGVTFVQRGGVSRDTHIELIQRSCLAPAITGTWQVGEGYVPCRIFKNISYGQLGLTNSASVNEVFEGRLVTNPDTYQLFADGEDALRAPAARARVRELMQTVRDSHTYVQRIGTILQVLP